MSGRAFRSRRPGEQVRCDMSGRVNPGRSPPMTAGTERGPPPRVPAQRLASEMEAGSGAQPQERNERKDNGKKE